MNLEDARTHVGDTVIYQPHPGARAETGVITRVTETGVFVRYGTDGHAKLTRAQDLRPDWVVFQEPR